MTTRLSLILLIALGVTAALAISAADQPPPSRTLTLRLRRAPHSQSRPSRVSLKPRLWRSATRSGLRAPEFGMSLLDGSKVTSAELAEEGTPVFLYFHATY